MDTRFVCFSLQYCWQQVQVEMDRCSSVPRRTDIDEFRRRDVSDRCMSDFIGTHSIYFLQLLYHGERRIKLCAQFGGWSLVMDLDPRSSTALSF